MQPARSASISKVLPQPIPLLLKERHKTMECVQPARPESTKELLPQHLAFLVPQDTTLALPCRPDVQLALWENILIPLKQLPVRFVLLVLTTIRLLQILPACLVPQDTTPTLPCHLSAMVAPKVSTATPQQTQTATPVSLERTTIKRPRLPPRLAWFVLRDPIKMQVAVTNANCAQLAKH